MKGIIVAAGYGTRFLPVTKTVPKELLPIGVTPSIAYIAQEFVDSGIVDIIVITSRRKKALEDYFDREIELEELFAREGRKDRLEKIQPLPARVSFVRQTEMRGTGHALLQVAHLLGGEPCVVAIPTISCLDQNRSLANLSKSTSAQASACWRQFLSQATCRATASSILRRTV